ncbi:hypothetical protein Fcan01_24231 [Folsomia candida]|uniref:Uncharacterized protein n=1 Tax=Folsomia candida TaxID=158441 RepID=A0A226D9A8_FOLCA|nr:hypothetical protein Fcan01_24231 [Folsomia candida]
MTGIGLDVLVALGTIFFISVPWATTLHYLLFPQTPIFLTTLLPPKWRNDTRIYWGYSSLPTYYAFAAWQNLWVFALLGSVYMFSILPLLCCEFRVGGKNQKTRALRSAWNLPLEYRCVELMHTQLMSFVGYALTGLHVAFGQFILFANVSVISDKSLMENQIKVWKQLYANFKFVWDNFVS